MNEKFRKLTVVGSFLLVALFVLSGCTTGRQHVSTNVLELQDQLSKSQREIKSLKGDLGDAQRRASQAEDAMARAQNVKTKLSPDASLLPPQASPGECYARVFMPPAYDTATEKVLKREASERIEIIPAEYAYGEEKVLVREASTRLEEVPAQYGWAEEKILVKPAHTTWKKGRGLIEKVDHSTGEIMCLVEVPATYKTVKKRVLKAPATTRSVEIPAQYKTVKVKKMVQPPQERRIEIPAAYETVTKKALVSDGRMEWRPVICETNMSRDLGTKIQSALLKAGFNPGPIDGVIGRQTSQALRSYQREKGLAVGGLTYSTVKSLGIRF